MTTQKETIILLTRVTKRNIIFQFSYYYVTRYVITLTQVSDSERLNRRS